MKRWEKGTREEGGVEGGTVERGSGQEKRNNKKVVELD
jgi:hypothetical protein